MCLRHRWDMTLRGAVALASQVPLGDAIEVEMSPNEFLAKTTGVKRARAMPAAQMAQRLRDAKTSATPAQKQAAVGARANCNGNGDDLGSSCACYPGWGTADCSVADPVQCAFTLLSPSIDCSPDGTCPYFPSTLTTLSLSYNLDCQFVAGTSNGDTFADYAVGPYQVRAVSISAPTPFSPSTGARVLC